MPAKTKTMNSRVTLRYIEDMLQIELDKKKQEESSSSDNKSKEQQDN